MPQLTGMAVTLITANDDEAGTDNHLYIGVVGSGGGREFPLASEQEDFNAGEVETFALGLIWEGGFIVDTTKFPLRSGPGGDNDPALIPLDVERVGFVYLRKQGDNTTEDDDAYKLKDLRVVLYSPTSSDTPPKRIFRFLNGGTSLWIANEHGHVVYLEETREG
jgi:hypothetical protein